MIIYIKNVIIIAKLVLNQEMKQIIIAMNVQLILHFLMNLLLYHKIVLKNVIIIFILMKVTNILALNLIYAQPNIVNL
jgi:hypothetical protein